jgi:putative ABC transport system ATP-binding protein
VSTTLFETRALCKVYRTSSQFETRALDNVTLDIERGTLTAVSGPSGSGKTTLLALLGVLDRPSSGQIVFDGKELTKCSDVAMGRVRRRMGFVFQDFSLIPNLTALENITYALIPRRIPPRERHERARVQLARLGVETKLHMRASELSGGEQQRVAIARALACEPEVILADEPTSNLDEDTARLAVMAFREMHNIGKTVVFTTHDPRMIELATCTFKLVGGRLVR